MTTPEPDDPLIDAARRANARDRAGAATPEPSLGSRLGQIGVLGWAIVVPILIAVVIGRWLDHRFATGVFFSAPMILIGAAIGFRSAWKWMNHP